MILTNEQIEKLCGELEDIVGIDSVDVETADDNENDVKRITGTGGYGAGWDDRDGREAWVDVEFDIDMDELSYTCEGTCSTSDGRHDETSTRDGVVDSIDDLYECIDGDFSDIAHEIDG